ncbi:MAG: DAK2 domain-containing protein [Candidatus Eremiobacteraeota bacterium]|nr:DAK2 domain-containing protein [Candidatus Eremiobacteraeota bacterium]MBV8283706.1 DAK2 domain-containing protein [Candidatus Eremiobacteraeota bacterium]MBV8433301.1 DAK2 domain-containing protein [Candidatus Eremiobacteraeota bacterium]
MDVIALDGRGYAKFLAAGTYFLRKYRQVLNDLNVFPVPDGDTGTNMYLTVRAATLEAAKVRDQSISEVAAQAAQGSLMGARGNSGVIISQMLRGFAHHVRHRSEIDTFVLATAMREAAAAARQALVRPVEGTIVSVADAAAEAAYQVALKERDFYRFIAGVIRAANDALDRTPDQLPVLKEAGVVDSGGAGFVYFLEGILSFLPDVKVRATAFPRRPVRQNVFTAHQIVGEHKYCTEFVLEDAAVSVHDLRRLLEPRGESLLVIGAEPTIKVHLHTDSPEKVKELAAKYGTLTRVKVDNMEQQHNVLVVDKPERAYSVIAIVPGEGFERIVRELGAEVVVSGVKNPSVRDLLLAVNKTLSDVVYVFVNDKNVALAAAEVTKLSDKTIHVIPTRDVVAGIAGQFALRNTGDGAPPEDGAILQAASRVRAAQLFFAGKDATLDGVTVARGKPAALTANRLFAGETLPEAGRSALEAMGAAAGGLITLYYGGLQKERDAQRLASELQAAFPNADVEYYYGGMKNAEYWLSLDD